MATKVDICNLALSRVRAGSIGDLTEQSPQAVQCNILYDLTRDEVLTSFSWGFAKVTRALSLTGNTPDEWTYEYDYPNDCLRIHYIIPVTGGGNNLPPLSPGVYPWRIDHEAVPYEVGSGSSGSRVILTDYEDAYISYTKAVTDERLFDPLFTQALAWRLAIDLAIPLGGDSSRRYREEAQRAYRDLLAQAASLSANEHEGGHARLPRTIQARTASYGSDYPYWRFR